MKGAAVRIDAERLADVLWRWARPRLVRFLEGVLSEPEASPDRQQTTKPTRPRAEVLIPNDLDRVTAAKVIAGKALAKLGVGGSSARTPDRGRAPGGES